MICTVQLLFVTLLNPEVPEMIINVLDIKIQDKTLDNMSITSILQSLAEIFAEIWQTK